MEQQNEEKVSVLMVDDRPEILMSMTAILRSPSLNLVAVRSAREAMEALDRDEFALILLDVDMPNVNGFDAARQIRDRPQLRHVPIIFVTATMDQRDFVFESYATGVVDIIFKPFEPVIMVSKVDAFVSLYRHERRLKRAIEAQLKMKDMFLSQVSHELRTPLNALTRFLEIVEGGMAGDLNDEQQEYLSISLRNARSLNGLISDLLEVVRAQNDKLSVVPHCIAVSEILGDLRTVLEANAETKGNSVRLEVPEGLPLVWADPSRICQVILNLTGNAMKFGPKGMPLTIRAGLSEREPNMLQVDVEDQGPGISQEKIAAIFDPLHQDNNTPTETSRKGLGLGLFICKELICQHGGSIWANSAPGSGSTFSFTLPCFGLNTCLPEKLQKDGRFCDETALITFAEDSNGSAQHQSISEPSHRRFREVLEKCTRACSDVILPGNLLKANGRNPVSLILTSCGSTEKTKLIERCRQGFEASRRLKVPLISTSGIAGEKLTSLFDSADDFTDSKQPKIEYQN